LDFENVEHYGLVGDCLAGPQTIDAIVGRPAIKVERTMGYSWKGPWSTLQPRMLGSSIAR
jgi:hypothetical protein